MTLDVAKRRQEIVQPQTGAQGREAVRIAAVDREQERQRPDEMRSQASPQQIALLAGGEDEPQVAQLEIAQATMDELGRATAGAAGEVPLVDQADGKPAKRRLTGNPRSVDATPDDQDIERSTGKRGENCRPAAARKLERRSPFSGDSVGRQRLKPALRGTAAARPVPASLAPNTDPPHDSDS